MPLYGVRADRLDSLDTVEVGGQGALPSGGDRAEYLRALKETKGWLGKELR